MLSLETCSCLKGTRKLYRDFGFTPIIVTKDMEKYGQVFDQEFWELKL